MGLNKWVERASVRGGRRPFLHQILEKFGKLISVATMSIKPSQGELTI